jgi:type IV pilus assembly protein PilC
VNNIKTQLKSVYAHAQAGSHFVYEQRKKLTKPNLPALKKFYAQSKKGVLKTFDRFTARGLSTKEQTFFIKRLAFLIHAGVPVIETLHIMRGQSKSKAHGRILDAIIHDTSNGQALSKSFAKFPKLFNHFAIHIIKIGESSGTLSQNLNYLADELKKKQALKRKVIGAFIYPVIITIATFAITAFLMLYLFPKIMPIFTSLHMKLPITTRIVMFLSIFLQHWGLLVIILIILSFVIISIIRKKNLSFHFFVTRASMKIPVIGKVMRYYNVANGSRTLSLLLTSGIRLSDALPITSETTTNVVYQREYSTLGEAVNRGEQISTRLHERQEFFPDIFTHMIAVGERSGTLSETLAYLSELYDNEVDDFTKNLSTLMEPMLMVFMGLIIGFIAISIITPIYGITQSLQM